MAAHDNACNNLFSHPQLVRDLLRGFVPESWVDEFDFATLEKASRSYVNDDLRDREDDIIWRLRHRDAVVYICLLLQAHVSLDKSQKRRARGADVECRSLASEVSLC